MGGQLQGAPALVVLLGVAVLVAVHLPVRLLVELWGLQVVVMVVVVRVVVVYFVGLHDELWVEGLQLEQRARQGARHLLQQQGLQPRGPVALRRPNRAREGDQVEGGVGAAWPVAMLLGARWRVWRLRPGHVASGADLQLWRGDDVESGPRLLRLLVLLQVKLLWVSVVLGERLRLQLWAVAEKRELIRRLHCRNRQLLPARRRARGSRKLPQRERAC